MTPEQRERLAALVKAGDIEQAREVCKAMGWERLDLSGSDLAGANLRGANLTWTHLYGANLAGANLTGAKLHWAIGLKVTA
mgnify:FL=1